MRRQVPAVALAVAALAVAGCGGSDESSGETTTTETSASGGDASLSGSVGPGFDISVEQASAAPGTYTLTVDDQSASHNFHLTGPGGVDVATDVGGTGTETFEVTLQNGTYTFVCDPHASSMRGTLEVG
jgi:plastocyanin